VILDDDLDTYLFEQTVVGPSWVRTKSMMLLPLIVSKVGWPNAYTWLQLTISLIVGPAVADDWSKSSVEAA
jgi:hypothetical protein